MDAGLFKWFRARLLLADSRNHMFGAEVRDADGGEEFAQRVLALEVDVLDAEPFLFAERVEVLYRQEADVRCVVPFVRQFLGLGHATMEHEASAGSRRFPLWRRVGRK